MFYFLLKIKQNNCSKKNQKKKMWIWEVYSIFERLKQNSFFKLEIYYKYLNEIQINNPLI